MPFQIVEFRDPLWRADYNYFAPRGLASNNYNGAKYKFFATQEHEVASYTRKGMNKVKKWVPEEPLMLLPMFHRETRDHVYAAMSPEGRRAVDTAFPVDAGGHVYRVSEEDSTWADYAFLDELCRMGIADGYIIPAQLPRGNGAVGAFHSEVGLCFAAFDALRLADIRTNAPPAMTRKRRGPRNNSNNNARNAKRNRRNNGNGTRRYAAPPRFAMFMNANNAPN
jgi:hypothetical protein